MKKFIFALFLLLFITTVSFGEEQIFISKVEKISDWEKGEHYFKINIKNSTNELNQVFLVKVPLEDLANDIYYNGLTLVFENEQFIPEDPGYSIFTYKTANGLEFQGRSESIMSAWMPEEKTPLEVQSVTRDKWGVSYRIAVVFSNNKKIYLPLDDINLFRPGDKYFQASSNLFVNVDSGKLVNIKLKQGGPPHFISKTW
jgi:hypothetical protein